MSRRLRVVYVDHCARLSGAEIALSRLLPALTEHVDPLVLLGEDGPLVGRLESLGIEVDVLPLDARTRELRKDTVAPGRLDALAALRVLPYTARLARRLRAEKADLVHTNSLKAALYGGAAGRLARVPVVWHVRDRIAPDYLPAPAVTLVRSLSRVVPSALVANSRSTLATLPPHPRGVVVDNVVPGPPPGFTRDTGQPLTYGVVGRLAPWKGQHVFLEAFAAACAGTSARARLVGSAMFGEEEYEQQLRRQVAEFGIQGQVEFRGFREDVWAELAELDVLVHCSTSPEPFGQVVVEGMLAGCAVVAADEGGPAEVVTHGVDGLLVPPRDVTALATALGRLRANPQLHAALADGGTGASDRFAGVRSAALLLEVYRSAATAVQVR